MEKKKLNNFLIPLFILQLKLGTSVTIHDNIQLEMSEEIFFFFTIPVFILSLVFHVYYGETLFFFDSNSLF